ncbi:MAG: hypothetical protein ABSC94_18515 [Polyangiaceae bacterium]
MSQRISDRAGSVRIRTNAPVSAAKPQLALLDAGATAESTRALRAFGEDAPRDRVLLTRKE